MSILNDKYDVKNNQNFTAIQIEIESLRAKVKELDAQFRSQGTFYELLLSDEQSKVKVLTDAATIAADQIRVCDYTPARSTLLVALATVRGK